MSRTAPTLLTTAQLLARIPISRASLYRMVADERIGLPRKLGRRSFWPAETVDQIIGAMPEGLADVSAAVEARQRTRH